MVTLFLSSFVEESGATGYGSCLEPVIGTLYENSYLILIPIESGSELPLYLKLKLKLKVKRILASHSQTTTTLLPPSPTMSTHPERNSIGYALAPNKTQAFIQPSLIQQAKKHNIELIPIDPSKPLIEQGPFDCIIHKLYGPDWESQLQHFSSKNPKVPIIDSLDSIQRLRNRVSMIQVVCNLKLPQRHQVLDVPKQYVVSDLQQTSNGNYDLIGDLGFPLIAKPLMANGSDTSHKMYLVFDEEGLDKLETPIILQEFVNHGGVIFKAYVAGDYVKCVKRKSLPDLNEDNSVTLKGLLPFSQISSASVEENSDFECVEMPAVDFVEEVAKAMKEETVEYEIKCNNSTEQLD
ncbi:unnamed protein product [Dovyalis caffra]|uniref:Inositol-tetrakisphosphate 1-kinase n=1 Tax=Dovyalis caffra TaxID=77055 RepID=A0AAV1R686_9ROSI|nr:unnamed protein product [Dovyalis caffra]